MDGVGSFAVADDAMVGGLRWGRGGSKVVWREGMYRRLRGGAPVENYGGESIQVFVLRGAEAGLSCIVFSAVD